MDTVSVETIDQAAKNLTGIVKKTPLQFIKRLSEFYQAKIYFKREDLQEVRSYKIRGAYNLISALSNGQRKKGVVCASAGNHAQGVALSAKRLKIKATIFMPIVTPMQKISKVKSFGDGFIEIKLIGKTYDESNKLALEFCKKENSVFVHPFEDYTVMSGQGTVGKEVYDELGKNIDFVLCPIGGGGLASGVSTYLKKKKQKIKIIGVEPTGAAGMDASVKNGKVVSLNEIDTFVDGAAVKTVGQSTFKIISKLIEKIVLVPEGKVCTTMIELYQNEGIVAEPAGALSISALDEVKNEIKGKNVVCILSGGNNDILRYPEIMEKSLVYKGLKHYFIINFAQKPGQLKQFVNHALGPNDDIVRFEYIKKTSKETGPALIGVQIEKKENFQKLLKRMDKLEINYQLLNSDDVLYSYLI